MNELQFVIIIFAIELEKWKDKEWIYAWLNFWFDFLFRHLNEKIKKKSCFTTTQEFIGKSFLLFVRCIDVNLFSFFYFSLKLSSEGKRI